MLTNKLTKQRLTMKYIVLELLVKYQHLLKNKYVNPTIKEAVGKNQIYE